MATETEYRRAVEAGNRFKIAVLEVRYDPLTDELMLRTAWGPRRLKRSAVDVLREVPPTLMSAVYASPVGIHLDVVDVDINSAGLLAQHFPELRPELVNSY
jgi:hypothetical protein